MNPFNPGYYHEDELREMGFKAVGENVMIAKNCTIIGLENIEMGSNVRIDGFCTITAPGDGWVRIGTYVHVGAYSFLSAGEGIQLGDFGGVSNGVRIYSRSDDFSGKHLSGPTIPEKYTDVTKGPVILENYTGVASGSIILPRVRIHEGSAVGPLSLVTKDLDPWGFYLGVPARRIKARSQNMRELAAQLMAERSRAE